MSLQNESREHLSIVLAVKVLVLMSENSDDPVNHSRNYAEALSLIEPGLEKISGQGYLEDSDDMVFVIDNIKRDLRTNTLGKCIGYRKLEGATDVTVDDFCTCIDSAVEPATCSVT